MSLRVCVDASRLNSGVFTIAAVGFGYDRATKASAEWERLMKGRTFHMTDLNARRGDFKDVGKDEVQTIMRGVVGILRNYASYTAAVSCDVSQITESFPISTNERHDLLDRAFRTPYGTMLHLCMWAMGRFANGESDRGQRISYILESGDEGQGGFVEYINHLMADPIYDYVLERYSLSSLTVIPKSQIEGAFHSADLVAWEWARQVDRQRQNRPMRGSLSAMTDQSQSMPDYFGMTLTDKTKHFYRHYSERNTDRWVRFLREMVEAKTASSIKAALGQWEITR